MLAQYIEWGKILKPQGIKGLVKIGTELWDAEGIEDLETVFLFKNDEYIPLHFEFAYARGNENAVYGYVNDAASRNDAEEQRNWTLYLDRDHFSLPENEDLIEDLIGSKAVGMKNHEEIGTLKDVFHLPSNDVYVFDTAQGEMMLPALLSVIPEVDANNQIIYIDEEKMQEMAVYQDE